MILGIALVASCLLLAISFGRLRAKPTQASSGTTSPIPVSVPKPPYAATSMKRTAALGNQRQRTDTSVAARLREEVSKLESDVYEADPLLRACELYEEKLDAWRSTTDAQGTIHNYVEIADRSSPDSKLKSRRSHSVAVTANLMSPLLLKEFASTPGLSELIRWFLEMNYTKNIPLFGGVDPVLGIDSNTRLAPQPEAASADQLLAEIDARYDKITNAIAHIAEEQNMSKEVLQAIQDRHTYMMLTDISRTYVLVRTPSELSDLRKQLRDAEEIARNTKN